MDNDEREIIAVLDGLYAMISGPAGPRDWRKQSQFFHPDCRQMRTGKDDAGGPWIKSFSPEQYREEADAIFVNRSFYEIEIAREIRVFGNMAHVWSAYEAKLDPADTQPERRGINSIQFYNDGDGWRIISMIWDNERPPEFMLEHGFPAGMRL